MTITSCNVIIVVIEDDPYIRELLSDTLMEQGYTVVAIARGDKALTVLPILRPALIILDLNLPGVSGQIILQELRQQPATQTLPVIVVSAQTIPPAVQSQVQASIPKPFDLDSFVTMVQQLVPLPIIEASSDGYTPLTRSAEMDLAIGRNPVPSHPLTPAPPSF